MYIYIYIHTFARDSICIRISLHSGTHTLCIGKSVCMYGSMDGWMDGWTDVCMCVGVFSYRYMPVCIQICVHIYHACVDKYHAYIDGNFNTNLRIYLLCMFRCTRTSCIYVFYLYVNIRACIFIHACFLHTYES